MLKNKLEALLFSSGRKISIEELSKLSKAQPDEIQDSLAELKKDYDEKNSSVMLVNEGDSWKLTVREQFLPLVQKIVTETELSKTITETLAVIAFKYPIKQSELIKIRTNKSYDHLKELEEMGYITRKKHGRSYLIKLTQKFFEYFDLSEEKLKGHFDDFASISKAIEEKEKEIETVKREQKAKAEEEKKKDESVKDEGDLLDKGDNKVPLDAYENKEPDPEKKKDREIKEEIDLVDKEGHKVHLDMYESKEAEDKETKQEKEKTEIKVTKEKVGGLKIVDEPSEEEQEKERERLQQIREEDKQQLEEKEKPQFEGDGVKVTEEMEKIIDKKVENIIHPPKEEGEEQQRPKRKEEKESEEEPKDLLEAEMEESKKTKK